MRQQVIAYVKPASELKAGDRILSERMVVGEVESVERFANSHKQDCVAVAVRSGAALPTGMCFLAGDSVLVME